MKKRAIWTLGPEIQVETFKFQDDCWVVSASVTGTPACPGCGKTSSSRHSWHSRQLQDLPAQGMPVVLKLRLGRWRCHNNQCMRKTFVERLSSSVAPFARRTSRVAEIVRLFCHAAGGRVSERLLARLHGQLIPLASALGQVAASGSGRENQGGAPDRGEQSY